MKNNPGYHLNQAVKTAEMDKIFKLCRKDEWDLIYQHVVSNPAVGAAVMTMDNHITTTVTHQAITSKGDVVKRAKVVEHILSVNPKAAEIKNGYGSLPLHVICQRNTKMTSKVKERLIFQLIEAYPDALVEEGGTGKRTPLHIIFTGTHTESHGEATRLFLPLNVFLHSSLDYINPRLVDMMIDRGSHACFMRDKKGWLPAHVACSRHCSPDKLRMLLRVHPGALEERTNDGKSLLDLASASATQSHPNFALIEEINRQLKEAARTRTTMHSYRPVQPRQNTLHAHTSAPPTAYAPPGHYYSHHYAARTLCHQGPVPAAPVPAARDRHQLIGSTVSTSSAVTSEESSSTDGRWVSGTGGDGPSRLVSPTSNRKRKSSSIDGVATAYSLLMLSRDHIPTHRPQVSMLPEEAVEASTFPQDVISQPTTQEPPRGRSTSIVDDTPIQIVKI